MTAKDQSRIHQFVKKVFPGLFLGYALYAGGIWKGDLLVAEDFSILSSEKENRKKEKKKKKRKNNNMKQTSNFLNAKTLRKKRKTNERTTQKHDCSDEGVRANSLSDAQKETHFTDEKLTKHCSVRTVSLTIVVL